MSVPEGVSTMEEFEKENNTGETETADMSGFMNEVASDTASENAEETQKEFPENDNEEAGDAENFNESAPQRGAEMLFSTAEDYKTSIKRLKKEYKERQKAEKNARKAAKAATSSGTSHTVLAAVISSVVTLVIVAGAFLIMTRVPSEQDSYFTHLVKKYATTPAQNYPSDKGTEIGGQKIEGGSSVTIEVSGEASVAAVYAKASKSVVGIEVCQRSGPRWETKSETVISQGSGVIYSEDGKIITNFHVIESAMDTAKGTMASDYVINVYFDTDLSEKYQVTNVIGYDIDCDIALIKVDVTGLAPMEFGDSDKLSIGETVVAIGSPGGLEFMNSVSEGILSGIERDITSSSGTVVYDLLQTTAAINPGNSGGALLNAEGQLIGICVIKIVSEDYEGMGFAITSNTAKLIAESLLQYGRYVKPVLGVEIDTRYDAAAAANAGWPTGAYVNSVTAGGAAEKAGIKADDIICEIGSERIKNFSNLRKYLLRYSPTDSVKLKIYRASVNEYIDITVNLDAS